MTTLHIVTSTGSYQGDRVLAGIYGTLVNKDGAPTATFQVAPEFKQVSHLFGYLESGGTEIGAHQTSKIEVPDEMAVLVKAELMHSLGARWAKMYQNMAPEQTGLMASMLKGEAAVVSEGVRTHLVSQGMRAFAVPVTVMITTDEDAYLGGSIEDVLSNLKDGEIAMSKCEWVPAQDEPIDLGTQRLGAVETPIDNGSSQDTASNSSPDDELDDADDDHQSPQSSAPWSNFQGAEIAASGFITVIARSQQEASMLASFKCNERYADTGAPIPKITYSEVTSIEEREAPPAERVTESHG